MADTSRKAPIVVGVDGSEGSRKALLWATKQAALVGSSLHVVHVVHYPVGFGPTLYPGVNLEILAAEAQQFATKVVEETLGGQSDRGLTVQGAVGSAAEVLLRQSKDANLLVVGARGHGGFAGLLIGSVTHQCVHHAHCPVVVVPDRD